MLMHFAQLKQSLPKQIQRIAEFLTIPIDESKWKTILSHCSFSYMKQNAPKTTPLGGICWNGGAQTFIYKGTNGRWRDLLTTDESQRYEQIARDKLGESGAHWLATGEFLE